MKKVLFGLTLLLAVLVAIPLFAAFEAHVINVTARIENALFVHPAARNFGTVFPQEYRQQGIFVSFSESFSEEDQTRVGTVEYQIKQKPKPRQTYIDEVGIITAREWCHDNYPQTPFDIGNQIWRTYLANCHPSLCPYLSKHPDFNPAPGNDSGSIPAFHDPFATSSVAFGKINKFGIDVGDTWIIDLAVPCFQGQCAQDWDDFVNEINPQVDPDDYVLPNALEHDVFGCDLWFEVTDIY
jgi:hypothetical protein